MDMKYKITDRIDKKLKDQQDKQKELLKSSLESRSSPGKPELVSRKESGENMDLLIMRQDEQS